MKSRIINGVRCRVRHIPLKRIFDLLFSASVLVILSPLLLLLALLIKASSRGPVLFYQVRMGRGGRLFRCYKFRSMRADAEKKSGPVWATQDDPRITRVGNFLRKTRIDELPQLINVFNGSMSLVGPRISDLRLLSLAVEIMDFAA